MTNDPTTLVQEITDVFIANNHKLNQELILDLAIYIVERDKRLLNDKLAKAIEEAESI